MIHVIWGEKKREKREETEQHTSNVSVDEKSITLHIAAVSFSGTTLRHHHQRHTHTQRINEPEERDSKDARLLLLLTGLYITGEVGEVLLLYSPTESARIDCSSSISRKDSANDLLLLLMLLLSTLLVSCPLMSSAN